jgi:putative transposase
VPVSWAQPGRDPASIPIERGCLRPQRSQSAGANVREGFTVLRIPAAHRQRLRTSNGLEQRSKEIKRRTRVATLFPNEAALLRFASAVLAEISDDWETFRAYLNMQAR